MNTSTALLCMLKLILIVLHVFFVNYNHEDLFFYVWGGCCTFTGVDVHGDWLAGGWTSSL